jgi:Mg2+ and Co2+ transporter CorA
VLTALGASVVDPWDNRYGGRRAVRFGRIALVPVTGNLLMSARHREGLDWIDPVQGSAAAALRRSALLKRDPYRVTSLLASIEARGRVGAATEAEELAIEIILATTQAYPRAVLDKFNAMLSAAEARFATIERPDDLDGEAQPRTSLSLLRLIAAVGRIEQAVRETGDDFERRTRARGLEGDEIEDVQASFDRILGSLTQIRGDTRTTVDMIGSTLSSAHLKIAREEAKAAADQRARHIAEAERRQAAEAEQREREQRLARSIALLTSVLLIPTLVASVFGANVELPRERSIWGTYLMFAIMIGLGALSFALLREFDPTRDRPGWKMRTAPLLIALISLTGATALALEWLVPE